MAAVAAGSHAELTISLISMGQLAFGVPM